MEDPKNLILPPNSYNEKLSITLTNDYLKKRQKIFSLATVLISSIGTLLAVTLLWIYRDISIQIIFISIFMYCLTMLGITVGFHRYFSHGSFQTNNFIRIILGILGSMAVQGSVIHWVSAHRRHHAYTDKQGDPHSPHLDGGIKGLWYAHIGWMFDSKVTNFTVFANDLLRDKTIVKIDKMYLYWILLSLLIPAVLGGLLTSTLTGIWQGFLWGGLVRIFLAHHATWSVNSIVHIFGTNPFKTQDFSKNNIWLVFPTLGGAWHNNHHAFPTSAKAGLYWWQIDFGYWFIRILELSRLVFQVKVPSKEIIELKKVQSN